MTQPNFNPNSKFTPEAHEAHLAERYARIERYRIFDELVDMALDGVCTFDQAMEQYHHDTSDLPPTPGRAPQPTPLT